MASWLTFEWWTYRPADFLMFSPRIYARLFASMNTAFWPLPGLSVGAGLAMLWWTATRPAGRPTWQVSAVGLALCTAFVGWAFLWQRFAPVQPIAAGFALAFGGQALALLFLAWRGRLVATPSALQRRGAAALAAWALVGHPVLGWALGRPWAQAEVFGLAPDPTALALLAWLLCWRSRDPATVWCWRLLWLVPVAWCLLSAATLAAMGSAQAWGTTAALLATMVLARQRPG